MPETISAYEALREYNATESPVVAVDLEREAKMRERNFAIPAELFRAPVIALCSVWPENLTSNPFNHGGVGRRVYRMAPGSPEKPSYLRLQNTYTLIQMQNGSDSIGYQEMPIMAAAVAVDLIQHWAGDHPGNARGKKGIGVIRGRQKENGEVEATPEEIKSLVTMQDAFLDFLIERADEFYDIGKREKITNEHRKALKMRGQDISLHPWYRSKIQLYNDCPWCNQKVSNGAIFCEKCRNDIPRYFLERNEIPSVEAWPRVVKEIDRLTKKGAPANVAH